MKNFLSSLQLKEIRKILPLAPYRDEKEFIQKAVEDKILEFRKLLFFEGSEKIRKVLVKKKIKIEDLVKKFDKRRHKR